MKILLTGGDGYIAKSLYNNLNTKYEITTVNRKSFDMTNFRLMNKFLKDKYFDVVIHCAVTGGNRLKQDSYKEMDANLLMYYNLLQHKDHYRKLINFGSGAEITATNTPYGLSKKIICDSILEIENFFNIRIFAVFDQNEWDTRFIKANIRRYINKQPLIVHENKKMDFFYMPDLLKLVEFYINTSTPPKAIDCTYEKTYTLLEVASFINSLDTHKCEINIEKDTIGLDYSGVHTSLLDYIGLKKGIENVFRHLIL